MQLLKSKTGEILNREQWEEELNLFWDCFESNKNSFHHTRFPSRPVDAWERYVKLMGLEDCK